MHKRTSFFVFSLALAVFTAGAAGATPAFVGQTVSGDLSIDGIPVPTGTTVMSPSRVASGAESGLIRLQDNRVIGFEANSVAVIGSAPSGGVQVAVKSGAVAVANADGTVMRLAADTTTLLEQEGQVGQGEPIEELVELCTFDEQADDWQRVEVLASQVEQRLAAGDVYPGDDGLDEDCEEDKAAIFWTTGKKVGLGLAGAAVLGFGIDELDSDDTTTRPASPVIP